jgi:hypothetical protein
MLLPLSKGLDHDRTHSCGHSELPEKGEDKSQVGAKRWGMVSSASVSDSTVDGVDIRSRVRGKHAGVQDRCTWAGFVSSDLPEPGTSS